VLNSLAVVVRVMFLACNWKYSRKLMNVKVTAKEGYHCVPIGLSYWLAYENSHPCLLLPSVAICEIPLEAGGKKDGVFAGNLLVPVIF